MARGRVRFRGFGVAKATHAGSQGRARQLVAMLSVWPDGETDAESNAPMIAPRKVMLAETTIATVTTDRINPYSARVWPSSSFVRGISRSKATNKCSIVVVIMVVPQKSFCIGWRKGRPVA